MEGRERSIGRGMNELRKKKETNEGSKDYSVREEVKGKRIKNPAVPQPQKLAR